MRLILIAPENVYEHEVDPSMEVQDVRALVEAETGLPSSQVTIRTDDGKELADSSKTLESYGLKGETATVFLDIRPQPVASSSSSGPSSQSSQGFPGSDDDLERMRLQALGNPQLMAELRANDPDMAAAISSGTRQFKETFLRHQRRQRDAAMEKQRQIELLNADPYDIEVRIYRQLSMRGDADSAKAQKKIEEAIRMEAVLENMQHAMEYSPEAFGNVTMLYINVEVNGHPVKAFVDSGAQTTIISPECAEACSIMRLLDTRFAGMAEGVGTARILGRVHSAQIKLGNMFLPCSFSVLEGRAVDLLFGLDMLKRHQCCIDLSTNTLRIQNTEIPFLAEHELPDKARRRGEADIAEELGEAASQGIQAGVASPTQAKKSFPGQGQSLGAGASGSGDASSSAAGGAGAGPSGTGGTTVPTNTESKVKEDDVQTLVGLGAERNQAIQLLEAAGGNVDYAASMLFGGGAQWPAGPWSSTAIDAASHGAIAFCQIYYEAYDEPTRRASDIPQLFLPDAKIIWNGNPVPPDPASLAAFLAGVPLSRHDLQTLDCHPVAAHPDFNSSPDHDTDTADPADPAATAPANPLSPGPILRPRPRPHPQRNRLSPARPIRHDPHGQPERLAPGPSEEVSRGVHAPRGGAGGGDAAEVRHQEFKLPLHRMTQRFGRNPQRKSTDVTNLSRHLDSSYPRGAALPPRHEEHTHSSGLIPNQPIPFEHTATNRP
ncbi:DNA damage-inducible protein 1 [Saitozyma podzolica]|uniref:DNA damage-inducible protein 1 n=1 Tax=Saitozyma podzolica TaxID=1890683 RepID=A0A427YHJ0_9TREE|nr:DNA damage-inducible protein 1 [Saitozyma podzolica]